MTTRSRRPARSRWKEGGVREFLSLDAKEAAFIEVKLALTDRFRDLRQRLRLSQSAAAERIGSSQSRVAKLEAGDASVSLDLLVRALLALGETPRGLGRVLARAAKSPPATRSPSRAARTVPAPRPATCCRPGGAPCPAR